MKNTTIHIFGYGEAQIIDETSNFKTDVSDFKKLQSVIDNIKSLKPDEIPEKEYHAITIFSNGNSNYTSKEKDGSFRFQIKQLEIKQLDALIKEFDSLKSKKTA